MADEEKEVQQPAAKEKVKEKEELEAIIGDPAATYKVVKDHLSHFKSQDGVHVEGVKFLDPNNESYNKFLTSGDFAPRRKQLKQRLELWTNLLEDDITSDEFADKLDKMIGEVETNLSDNMLSIHREIRPLEQTYRGIDLFFQNARATPESEVYCFFSNVGMEDLTNPNDREKFERINQQINDSFSVYDIRNCWSLCCIPGYPGSVKDVDALASGMGLPNKLHIVSDFKHFDTYEEISDELDDPSYDDMRGNDDFKQYISLFGNYVQADKPQSRFDPDAMWLAPSSIVAGMMYKNDDEVGIQAPTAGKANGKVGGAQFTRFRLTEKTNTKLNEKGVNCLLNWQGEVGDVVVMGADTLSKDPKFRNYTIKRTYDYIYKVMRNYLNQQVFKGFDERLKKTIDNDLNKFLSLLHRNKVINGFTCNVVADAAMLENQQMLIECALNTKTPIKQYVVKLEAMQDDSGNVGVN